MNYKFIVAIILLTATANVTIGVGAEAAIKAYASDPDDMTPKERYDSGFSKGCSDSHIWDESERYINQPKKGYSYHTADFNQGYREGFEECGYDGGVLSYTSNTAIDDSNFDDHSQQQGNAVETIQSNNQRGECGQIVFGDCNIGQSNSQRSENTQANSAQN